MRKRLRQRNKSADDLQANNDPQPSRPAKKKKTINDRKKNVGGGLGLFLISNGANTFCGVKLQFNPHVSTLNPTSQALSVCLHLVHMVI